MTRYALALIVLAGLTASCNSDVEPEEPSPRRTPGELTSTWQPSAPSEPVSEESASSAYAPLLDAVTAAMAEQVNGWSSPTVRTETFEGACAVTVERSASGAITPLDDAALDALSAVLITASFESAATADDPGGAVRYLSDGPDGALFELRSKGSTTVAVRVPTAALAC